MAAADVLLGDAFARLARFLSGVDLLRLSHANRRLFTELLAPDAREWRRRLPPPSDNAGNDARSAKQRCFQRTSVRFLGREDAAETSRRDRGGAVEVWSKGLPAHWASESFTVSLTFALLPGEAFGPPRSLVGGVLLGAQSVPWSSKRSPESPQQFVHVDPQGDLYCSVMDQKPVVARAMELERWYHVALVFERRGEGLATQRVFLDGELCHEAVGSLHSEWWNLRFGQLGSGCIGGAAPGTPTPGFSGWYGFHGVVDNCRLWRGVLQEDQVRALARGLQVAETDGCRVTWSLRGSGCDPLGHASYVRCSGPQERVCTDVRDVRDEFV